jgi:hypothetical protein
MGTKITKTKTIASLIPNLDHKTRKTRKRTQHVQNKNSTGFY